MQAERARFARIGDVIAFNAEGISKRDGILRIAGLREVVWVNFRS